MDVSITGKKYSINNLGVLDSGDRTKESISKIHTMWGSSSQGKKIIPILLMLLVLPIIILLINDVSINSLITLFIIIIILSIYIYIFIKIKGQIEELTIYSDHFLINDSSGGKELQVEKMKIYYSLGPTGLAGTHYIKYENSIYFLIPNREIYNYIKRMPQYKDIRIMQLLIVIILISIVFFSLR